MRKVREKETPTFPSRHTGRVMAPPFYTENVGQERTGMEGRGGGEKEKAENSRLFINLKCL